MLPYPFPLLRKPRVLDMDPVYVECEQKSEEWLAMRRKVGSSSVGEILGHGQGRVADYFKFVQSGAKTELNPAMEHGNTHEKTVVEHYQTLTGKTVASAGYVHPSPNNPYYNDVGASPDGWILSRDGTRTEGILECKAPFYTDTKHIKQSHISQCQFLAGICDSDFVDYMSCYIKEGKVENTYFIRIHYSDAYFNWMMQWVDRFLHNLSIDKVPDWTVTGLPAITVQQWDFKAGTWGPTINDFYGKEFLSRGTRTNTPAAPTASVSNKRSIAKSNGPCAGPGKSINTDDSKRKKMFNKLKPQF